MSVKVVNLPARCVAGYVLKNAMTKADGNKIPAFWEEIMQDGRHNKLHAQDWIARHDDYGLCLMTDTEDMDYLIGCEVKEGASVSDEFVIHNVPAGEYVVHQSGSVDDSEFTKNIMAAWDNSFNWIKNSSEYTFPPRENDASYEFYYMADENTATQACHCDVYIHIVKK
jgi:AraC family transcriptional regulator